MSFETMWQKGFKELNCAPNEDQQDKLKKYIAMLERWNNTYNLTAIRDPKEMIPMHIFDSLSVADYIQGETCLDIGSGAGLPTIPLAIMQPERQFMAIDTNGKKTRFIQQTIIELGLKNVQVSQTRIENWKPRIKYDAIISRAFASIYDFLTFSSAQLATNGILYAMKGQYPEGELQYIPKQYILSQCHSITVPFVEGERHLLEFKINHH